MPSGTDLQQLAPHHRSQSQKPQSDEAPYMDDISARDRMMKKKPAKLTRNMTKTPPVPPLAMARVPRLIHINSGSHQTNDSGC